MPFSNKSSVNPSHNKALVTLKGFSNVLSPVCTIVSASRSKVSRIPGFDSVVIDFVTDVPVDEWVARVGGHAPHNGYPAAHVFSAPTTVGQVTVTAAGLHETLNEIKVYVRSADAGEWSL